MTSTIFAARARLPAPWGAVDVDDRLDSVRHRWNQFGLDARVEVAGDADGIAVSYRLTVAGRPDPAEVHAAFREDLDAVLAGLAARPPATWDLEAMVRAQADATPAVRWAWHADTTV